VRSCPYVIHQPDWGAFLIAVSAFFLAKRNSWHQLGTVVMLIGVPAARRVSISLTEALAPVAPGVHTSGLPPDHWFCARLKPYRSKQQSNTDCTL